jgi:hypothetical protein
MGNMPMRARIATRLNGSFATVGKLLQRPSSLAYVAAPVLRFESADGGSLPARWETGTRLRLKLHLFGMVSLGSHVIELERVDPRAGVIVSREHGRIARVWNHRIEFRETAPGRVEYADEIEIRAGLLTPLVWLFAQLFYRHRQRRWRKLLRRPAH